MLETKATKANCIRAAADGDVGTLRSHLDQLGRSQCGNFNNQVTGEKQACDAAEPKTNGASIVQWIELTKTLFREAIENGHTNVVSELMKATLVEKIFSDPIERRDLLSGLLRGAIVEDYSEIVQCLLTHGADPNRSVVVDDNHDEDELLPLALAARLGSLEIAQLLLQNGALVNARSNLDGSTALHEAARQDEGEIIELLVQSGAAVDAQDDANGETALHVAVKRGSKQAVRELIRCHANISLTNKRGSCAVHLALVEAQRDILDLLASAGANIEHPAVPPTPRRK